MASIISATVATDLSGGACAMAGTARRRNAMMRIIPPLRGVEGLFTVCGSDTAQRLERIEPSLSVFFFKRIRSRHEEFPPIRERQIPAVDAPHAVLREIARNDDLGTQWE